MAFQPREISKQSLLKISIRTQETKYRKANTWSSYLGPMHPSFKPGYDELACEQALRGAMAEGLEKEGELSCKYVSGI